MGDLIFEFAKLESTAAEVITAKYRNSVTSADWAQSGSQLMKSLRKCFPNDSNFQDHCKELLDLTKWRNFYIHSEWIFFDDGSASLMNRSHAKNTLHPVQFDVNPRVEIPDLESFVHRTRKLDADFLPFILRAMGPWSEH